MTKPTNRDPHHHAAIAAPEDGRGALELSSAENADLCAGCVRCCTYITVEVDAPRSAWEYDQWIWALDHRAIEMYVERPERWFVHVETPCDHLAADGRCGIHGRHPVLCREYDPRSCERRLPLSEIRAWFHDGAELAAWIQRTRPAHWTRLVAYRGAEPPTRRARRAGAAAGLLSIAEPAGDLPALSDRSAASTPRVD